MSTFKNNQISVIEVIMGGKLGIDFQIKEKDIIGESFIAAGEQEAIISSFGFADSYRINIGSAKDKTKIEVYQSTKDCLDEQSILRFTISNAGKACLISPEAFAAPVTDALLKASNVEGYYKPFFEVIVAMLKLEN